MHQSLNSLQDKSHANWQAVSEIAISSARFLDEAELLQQIANVLVHKMGYRVAYFRLLQEGGLIICASAGSRTTYTNNPAYILPPGLGINGQVAQTAQPMAITDIRQEKKFHFRHMIEDEGLRGMLAVPLKDDDKVLGVLSCYTNQPHQFELPEIHLISQLSALAVQSLLNMRQNKLHQEVTVELAHIKSLPQSLNVIATESLRITNAEGVFFCVYDPVKGRFELENSMMLGLGQGLLVWHNDYPREDSIIRSILREEIVFVQDITAKSEGKRIGLHKQLELEAAGIRSFAGLRLQAGPEPVGILFLNFSQVHACESLKRDKALTILRHFSSQSAMAIERVRLSERNQLLERQKQENELLEGVTNAMRALDDVDGTWEAILHAAMRLTRAERGNISLVNQQTDEITNLKWVGFPDGFVPTERFRIGETSIQGWVAKHKVSALVKNTKTETKWKDIFHAGPLETLSELTVPIIHNGTQALVGIINLESVHPNAFDDGDLTFVQALAIRADIVVQNARLYQSSQRQVARLQMVSKAGQAIQAIVEAGFKAEIVWETIIEQAVKVTNSRFGMLQLVDNDDLKLIAAWPPNWRQKLQKEVPRLSIYGQDRQRNGITTRAIRFNESQLVPNVAFDPNFILLSNEIRSALAVVLRRNKE